MNATPATADAPEALRWNTANIFSSLSGADYRQAFQKLEADVAALEQAFDAGQIGRSAESTGASDLATTDAALADLLQQAIDGLNRLGLLASTLEAFIYAFISTDSYNTLAAREMSRLEVLDTRRRQLEVRLQGWLGSVAGRLENLLAIRPTLATHRFYLFDAARRSRYLMGEALEQLAAELCLDGATAFSKLQGNLTSQLKATLARDGATESLPVTVVHNLCFSPDAALRERAYRAEVAAWDSIRVPIAAALNSVKGTALTLARRRGRESVLAEALDDNRIDQATLDALLGAIRESFPVFRRYLSAKARKLGLARLRWWDLFAPVGESTKRYAWPMASELVIQRFDSFSDDMGRYAQRAFAERWIDVEPRDGKRGGAFCMGVVGVEESRILMNFNGSYEQVSTLAHELGHGYHNHCQTGLEPLRRGAPSTLAETASIFCETLLAEATLAESDSAELGAADRLAILESQLCGATQVCLDISSRFHFESALLERRGGGELSADEMCELMRAAQQDTYADAVEPETYHPYMWLWKPHYYQHTGNFYNFPYAFGQLFALGLYAVYRGEGASFATRYQQLLRSTGEELAAPLARRFGIDITGRDFWRASLSLVAEQVARYEAIG